MKFLERMSSIATEAAAIRKSMTIVDVRKEAAPSMGNEKGYRPVASGAEFDRKVAECASLIRDVVKGRKPEWHLREAMSTSDFPLIMGSLLYRQMLGNYVPWQVSYPSYFNIRTVKDFRTLHLLMLDGGQGTLSQVAQYAPYPETKFTESQFQLSVAKYGRRYGISWEMIVNDDLGAFNDRPALMANGARRTEELLATQQVFDANGPHASFFTSGNKNIITANPVLSIQALQTAMKVLAAQLDTEGQPIMIDAAVLVVGPSNQITAENIMNAVQLRINDVSGGGTADQFLYVNNWMRNKLTLAVNPYIPLVATNRTDSWALVASPANPSQRPAFIFGKLRGHETPELFVRDSNQINLGGGDVDPTEGDFDTDAIDYKLRHCVGATQGDPKMAVGSNSSGS